MRKVLKNIKEFILASSVVWMPIGGSILIEHIEPLIKIDFNWLGQVLPIPICIGLIALPFIFKD